MGKLIEFMHNYCMLGIIALVSWSTHTRLNLETCNGFQVMCYYHCRRLAILLFWIECHASQYVQDHHLFHIQKHFSYSCRNIQSNDYYGKTLGLRSNLMFTNPKFHSFLLRSSYRICSRQIVICSKKYVCWAIPTANLHLWVYCIRNYTFWFGS